MSRFNNRNFDEIRKISIETNVSKYAEGSCLVKFGNTQVLCTASVEDKVPPWMRGKNKGWITAEYGMLPRSTHSRIDRDVNKGKISGRTQEIQRLIGRSLRSVVDLSMLGEIQIKLDCDVIQADGGTRTAAITGAWIALYDSIKYLISKGKITANPIIEQVAAISCGIVDGKILIDLDYCEDSNAEVDANFILTDQKKIIEIQTTSEKMPISKIKFLEMYSLVEEEINIVFKKQNEAISQ